MRAWSNNHVLVSTDKDLTTTLLNITKIIVRTSIGILGKLIFSLVCVGRRLYWADAAAQLIGWTDLEGQSTGVLFRKPGSRFFGMDIYKNDLYVTDWRNNRLTLSKYQSSFYFGKRPFRFLLSQTFDSQKKKSVKTFLELFL